MVGLSVKMVLFLCCFIIQRLSGYPSWAPQLFVPRMVTTWEVPKKTWDFSGIMGFESLMFVKYLMLPEHHV